MNNFEYIYRTLRYTFGSRNDATRNLLYLIERDNRELYRLQKKHDELNEKHLDNTYDMMLAVSDQYNKLYKKQKSRIKHLRFLARKNRLNKPITSPGWPTKDQLRIITKT